MHVIKTDREKQLVAQARRQVLQSKTQEERFKWLILQAIAEGQLATVARQSELKRAA